MQTVLQAQTKDLVDDFVTANPTLDKDLVTAGVTLFMTAAVLTGSFYTRKRVHDGINNIIVSQGGSPMTKKQTRPLGLLVASALASLTWARVIRD